jgi:hypothetical protein
MPSPTRNRQGAEAIQVRAPERALVSYETPLNEVTARSRAKPGAWNIYATVLARCLDFIQTDPRLTRSAGPGSANSCSGHCPPSATRSPTTATDPSAAPGTPVGCAAPSIMRTSRPVRARGLRGGARMRERTLGPPEQPRAEDGGLEREAMCRVHRVEPLSDLMRSSR